jgi:hypothetical protein|nr:MAG TPA_asm: tail assembly chaperone protein [Bacteriophage sp.]
MVKVKINNKTYNVGELEFKDYSHIEEQGFSIVDAFAKNQYMLIAMGFTCVVLNCDRERAEEVIQQHVLGGGNVMDITAAFAKAVTESNFFQKMLGRTEEEEPETVEEEHPKTQKKTGGRQTQTK